MLQEVTMPFHENLPSFSSHNSHIFLLSTFFSHKYNDSHMLMGRKDILEHIKVRNKHFIYVHTHEYLVHRKK